jgi:hypothetical protein
MSLDRHQAFEFFKPVEDQEGRLLLRCSGLPQLCQKSSYVKKNNEKVNCRDCQKGQQNEGNNKLFDHGPQYIHDSRSGCPG